MYDFSYPLGNAVKSTRYQRGLTQLQVADMADIDVRTVMNIENYKANPKMEVLYPLIRALRIDARSIFNPELQRETPALQQLRLMIEECSEQEAEALIPVVESVIAALRTKDAIEIGCIVGNRPTTMTKQSRMLSIHFLIVFLPPFD